MRTFVQNRNQPQRSEASSPNRSVMGVPGPNHHAGHLLHLPPGHDLGRMPLHPKALTGIQMKPMVSTPGDACEREADCIADRVKGVPESASVCGDGRLRGEEEQGGRVQPQTWPIEEQDVGETPVPPLVQKVLSSCGQPLDSTVRSFMEPRLGHDFSQVRVYPDGRAAASADALGALAYTRGNQVVFARGCYAPQQPWGVRLLAHELAHVVQQRMPGATPSIQRVPVTGSRSSVSIYELREDGGGRRQVRTDHAMGGVNLRLVYDPERSLFTVTFPLVWLFSHSWTRSQRENYVAAFRASVRRVWNDKFLLVETRSPRRSAHVEIEFDSLIIPPMESALHEQAQLSLPNARRRWTMDVRDLSVRENVSRDTSVVELGGTSTQQQRRRASELRRRASFAWAGTGGNRTFTQATAPHEFGHMIGLGDEYIEDVRGERVPRAVRGYINNRIMNVGENVTPDAYAPFVEWLSGLTSSTWRIGRRVR
jgi:hypothetical protein